MSSSYAGDWERIRAAYPTQQPLLNLNNAAVSPPPLIVQEPMIDAYRFISQNPDVNMWSKLDAGDRLLRRTAHPVHLPKRKLAIQGPGGV
jgi:hypothetical protein